MNKFEIDEIVRGNRKSAPPEINVDSCEKILDYVRNLPWFKNKRTCMFILSIVLVKSWEPKDEAGRLALMQHLDDTLSLPVYTTAFPELTAGPGGVLETIHNIRLMGEYLVGGSGVGESDAKKVNSYKHSFFSGPVGASMALVPTATTYGVVPTIVPADAMGYIRTLRGILMRNKNWSDDIAKALWLYGTDGPSFDPATYVAHYSVHAFPGYMHFHVSTKNVHSHLIYIRKVGTLTWDAPIRFDGANWDVHRISTSSPENLEVMVMGFYDNAETVLQSVITPVTYTMPAA
jgi:hypothetical protein